MAIKTDRRQALRKLHESFTRGGCIRVPDPERRAKTPLLYRKGYEIRFGARDKLELDELRLLLESLGLRTGRPYQKKQRFIQPVYGRRVVLQLLSEFRKFS